MTEPVLTSYKVANVMEGLRVEFTRGPDDGHKQTLTKEQIEQYWAAYNEFLTEVGDWVSTAFQAAPDHLGIGKAFVATARAKGYELIFVDDDGG